MRPDEKHRHEQRGEGAAGFTLLEVLIATAISAIVLLAMYQQYTGGRWLYNKGEAKTVVQQNARVALELVSRELRMTGYDPNHVIPRLGALTMPATTQRAIQSATATSIRFIADVNSPVGTGPDGWGDMLEYTYDATCQQLRRKLWVWNPAASPPDFCTDSTCPVGPPPDSGCVEPPPIAEQLDPAMTTVFRYFYYDAAEANPNLKFKELPSPVPPADLPRIGRITLQVGTQAMASLVGNQAFRLVSDVRLRNQ